MYRIGRKIMFQPAGVPLITRSWTWNQTETNACPAQLIAEMKKELPSNVNML